MALPRIPHAAYEIACFSLLVGHPLERHVDSRHDGCAFFQLHTQGLDDKFLLLVKAGAVGFDLLIANP